MRLHQPDRPLQPPQHVHCPRSGRARFSHDPVLDQWILVAVGAEFAAVGVQWQEDLREPASPRRDRDFPQAEHAQEGIVHQARISLADVLLLPVLHDCRAHPGRNEERQELIEP